MTERRDEAARPRHIPNDEKLRFVVSDDGYYLWGMDEPAGGWGTLVAAIQAGDYDRWLTEGSPVAPLGGATPSMFIAALMFAPDDVVLALLERGVPLDQMEPTQGPRMAPLAIAVGRDRDALVPVLLAHGADPQDGIAASVTQGNRQLFEVLVRAGADPDIRVTEFETLLQMSVGANPSHNTAATNAGITARIREIIAAKRTGPSRTLRSARSKKKTTATPFSAFARTRAGRDLSWVVFAVEGGPDGVADAIAPQGSKVELDAANRRVIGCDAQYALQMKGSPWTWALVGHVGRRVAVFNFDADGFAAQLTTKLGRRVITFKGFVVSDWKDGVCSARHDLSPERMADDVGAKAVGKEHRELAYRRLDELCAAEGLRLPNMQDAGDGFEIVLEVFDCPESDVERLDVIVTR